MTHARLHQSRDSFVTLRVAFLLQARGMLPGRRNGPPGRREASRELATHLHLKAQAPQSSSERLVPDI